MRHRVRGDVGVTDLAALLALGGLDLALAVREALGLQLVLARALLGEDDRLLWVSLDEKK